MIKKIIIDKGTDILYKPDDMNAGININQGNHYFWPKWYSNGYLIDFISATDLINCKNGMNDERLLKITDKIDEESNPVLIVFKD